MDEAPIQRLREVKIFENRFVEIYDDEVRFGGAFEGRYLRIRPAMPGRGVVVMPVKESKVGLVYTYRYPIAGWQWALPRGFSQGEDSVETARSELLEELGAKDAVLREIGVVTPDSGLQESKVVVYVAEVSEYFVDPVDTQEVTAVEWIALPELWRRVAAGEIADAFTLSALTLAVARGEVPFPPG